MPSWGPCRLTMVSVCYRVEDKHTVGTLTHIPVFLPEITIGAHEYDEKYYAYKSVRSCFYLINM